MGKNSAKQKVQRQVLERLSCIESPSSNLPNDQTHLGDAQTFPPQHNGIEFQDRTVGTQGLLACQE